MKAFLAALALGWAGSLLSVIAAAAEPCPTQCESGNIPLGVDLPLTGAGADFGRPIMKTIETAIGELNKAGGVLGVPVQAIIGDDRCDAGMATSVATRHVEQDKVRFVIGPSCPAVAMDAAPIYSKAGVIQFVPTVTAIELTQQNPQTVFRMVATDEQEARALAAYLAREQAGKNFAVVHSNFFYRRAIAKMIEVALSPEQKKLARFEPLADVTGAYDRLVDKLRQNPPDVIYISLDIEQIVEFVRKLREKGIRSQLIGGQHLLVQRFWRTSRPTAEAINVIAPVDELNKPALKRAVDLLLQNDVVPDIVTLSNLSAVQVWADAVRHAGSGDSQKVTAVLRSRTFETGVGPVAFDERGDRRNIRFSIMSWKDGRLVPGLAWRQDGSQ